MLNTTPATWATNETVTATKMNTEIRDALTGIQSAWTTFSPTWNGSVSNPSIGNGTLTGSYTRFGKTVIGRIKVLPGSTTTFGSGTYQFGVPVTPHTDYSTTTTLGSVGNASLYDASSGSREFRHVIVGSSTYFLLRDDTNTSVTNTAPWTWANGDGILINFTYEAA